MTSAPAVYGQFGQALGLAERTLTDMLREHLAKRDVKPETWYALQLIPTRGPGLSRDLLIHLLEGSRSVDTKDVRELLARLEARRLIRGDAELDLTDDGAALHRGLRDYIAGPSIALLSQFDIDDIETTVRTLQAITERAGEQAASSPATRTKPIRNREALGPGRT